MKTLTIGLPCTPAERIDFETIEVAEVLVSYGRVTKPFWVTKRKNLDSTLLTGEVIKINPDFIVTERTVTLVKQVIDTTAHSNHREPTCEESIVTEYYKLKYGQKFELVDSYYRKSRDSIVHLEKEVSKKFAN